MILSGGGLLYWVCPLFGFWHQMFTGVNVFFSSHLVTHIIKININVVFYPFDYGGSCVSKARSCTKNANTILVHRSLITPWARKNVTACVIFVN
jgi:hypothetical protein